MGKINILDDLSSNMIAAGEVVDRPASALKELLENSVDAGAKKIAVYLKNGGNTRIRVRDDGEGILREDLPKTLYRHATSKIKTGYDLANVRTLGFRGEALAAAAAVSRLEIISKTPDEAMGSRLVADENGVELYETGCPDGTTVTIDDLFYNVPARRKFMKRDASEAAACFAVGEKIALGHPDIALSVYSEDKLKFSTYGDGKPFSALYAIYGGETAKTFTPVTYELSGIRVEGYISLPESPRGNRGAQNFFVNRRYVRSKTMVAALEEAYRSYIPSGKFPAACLFITIQSGDIDVNVHPAKTEIKFADERKVFSAVYYAVKSTLTFQNSENVPAADEKITGEADGGVKAAARGAAVGAGAFSGPSEPASGYGVFSAKTADSELDALFINSSPMAEVKSPAHTIYGFPIRSPEPEKTAREKEKTQKQETLAPSKGFRIMGEAYNLYIFAEFEDGILIIDKHAAHERIIYESLKDKKTLSTQTLLFPVAVTLTPAESEMILQNAENIKSYGFFVEEFGPSTVAVREIPAALRASSPSFIKEIFETFAKELALTGNMALCFEERADKALYTMACKAAIKAGDSTNATDLENIVETALKSNLKYCPHGRPFIKKLPKGELDKYFDR